MIRCLLLDDEPLAISVLEHHLASVSDVDVVGSAQDPVRALERLRRGDIDLLFADIQMPGMTGIDLARMLRGDGPAVIFTTAHREFALEGFDVEAVDYLLKPVGLPAVLRALERYRRRTSGPGAEAAVSEPILQITSGHQTIRVPGASVHYLESRDDVVLVHTGDRTIETRTRIGAWEEELSGSGFLRIHRAFLVRVASIAAYTSTQVALDSGEEVPIGRSYRQAVAEALGRA